MRQVEAVKGIHWRLVEVVPVDQYLAVLGCSDGERELHDQVMVSADHVPRHIDLLSLRIDKPLDGGELEDWIAEVTIDDGGHSVVDVGDGVPGIVGAGLVDEDRGMGLLGDLGAVGSLQEESLVRVDDGGTYLAEDLDCVLVGVGVDHSEFLIVIF